MLKSVIRTIAMYTLFFGITFDLCAGESPFEDHIRQRISQESSRHSDQEQIQHDLAILKSLMFPDDHQLLSATTTDQNEPTKSSSTCLICQESISDGESSWSCDSCHKRCQFDQCLEPWLKNEVDHKKRAYSCVNPECKKPIKFRDLAHSDVLSKRFLAIALAQTSTLTPCFRCQKEIIVAEITESGLKFQSSCPSCSFSSCHKCGFLHSEIACRRSKGEFTWADLNALISEFGSENVGACPGCRLLIVKNDGCSEMICGQNTEGQYRTMTGNTGCGKKFDQSDRLTVRVLRHFYIKKREAKAGCNGCQIL